MPQERVDNGDDLAMKAILEEEEQRKLDEQKRLMEELDRFDWGLVI
jgi:hypothetical protein